MKKKELFTQVQVLSDNGTWKNFNRKIFPEHDWTRKGKISAKSQPMEHVNDFLFSFLGMTNNFSLFPIIMSPSGLPKDTSEALSFKQDSEGSSSKAVIIDSKVRNTHLLLKDLLSYDYDQKSTRGSTVRQLLGDRFFKDLDILSTIGRSNEVRVVFSYQEV